MFRVFPFSCVCGSGTFDRTELRSGGVYVTMLMVGTGRMVAGSGGRYLSRRVSRQQATNVLLGSRQRVSGHCRVGFQVVLFLHWQLVMLVAHPARPPPPTRQCACHTFAVPKHGYLLCFLFPTGKGSISEQTRLCWLPQGLRFFDSARQYASRMDASELLEDVSVNATVNSLPAICEKD